MHEMHEKFIGIKRHQEDVPGGWLVTINESGKGDISTSGALRRFV